jgi:hypothetical protein
MNETFPASNQNEDEKSKTAAPEADRTYSPAEESAAELLNLKVDAPDGAFREAWRLLDDAAFQRKEDARDQVDNLPEFKAVMAAKGINIDEPLDQTGYRQAA